MVAGGFEKWMFEDSDRWLCQDKGQGTWLMTPRHRLINFLQLLLSLYMPLSSPFNKHVTFSSSFMYNMAANCKYHFISPKLSVGAKSIRNQSWIHIFYLRFTAMQRFPPINQSINFSRFSCLGDNRIHVLGPLSGFLVIDHFPRVY